MLKISFIIQLAKNLLVSSIIKDSKIDISNSDCENKIVKRLFPFKNLNKILGYSIFNARLAFIKLKHAFTKALIF